MWFAPNESNALKHKAFKILNAIQIAILVTQTCLCCLLLSQKGKSCWNVKETINSVFWWSFAMTVPSPWHLSAKHHFYLLFKEELTWALLPLFLAPWPPVWSNSSWRESCWFFSFTQDNETTLLKLDLACLKTNCSPAIKKVLELTPLIPQLLRRFWTELLLNWPKMNLGMENTVFLVSSSHLELLGMCWWMQSLAMDHDVESNLLLSVRSPVTWVLGCGSILQTCFHSQVNSKLVFFVCTCFF